jgi:hypothetical protein
LESLADTLIERVDKLVRGKEPLLSTTPTSVAVRELGFRTEALENAVREIALEVQKLAERDAGMVVVTQLPEHTTPNS